MAEHVHWKKAFPTDYFGSQHMPADGSDIVVTIKEVKHEKVQNGHDSDTKTIIYITAEPEKWIANKTNCERISNVVKSEFEDEWVGKKIQLYVEMVSAFGKTQPAIRVREWPPQ